MSERGTALQVTPGIQREFHSAVLAQLPDLVDEDMQKWNRNKRELGRQLREALMPNVRAVEFSPSWREEGGVIYFSVTSDGITGEEWINRLEDKGFRVSDYAKVLLRSPDFKPTSGVTTEVAVLKGMMLFGGNDRTTKKIRAEADNRKLTKPNAELACLIREKFTDKEIEGMGLWWIVVMDPIKDSGGVPLLLGSRSVSRS